MILLYGIASLCIIAALVMFWQASVRSGYKASVLKKNGCHVPTFKDEVASLFDENIHKLLMTPPTLCLLIFTILPLLYMMSMAFTNYSKEGDHLVLFDWVGMSNFFAIFDSTSVIGNQFADVLLWTLIWAFFATFLNFFMGTIMAIIINRPSIRCKGLWRGCLSMTIAVPPVCVADGDAIHVPARRYCQSDAEKLGHSGGRYQSAVFDRRYLGARLRYRH